MPWLLPGHFYVEWADIQLKPVVADLRLKYRIFMPYFTL